MHVHMAEYLIRWLKRSEDFSVLIKEKTPLADCLAGLIPVDSGIGREQACAGKSIADVSGVK